MIPFSPPRIDEKTIAAVTDALQSGWITTGPKTKLFEQRLAAYIGVSHVVCLNSATAGMQLILNWLGVKQGDEVIVPAYTYCATANVVIHAGATPIMVDVNEADFNISTAAVKKAITSKTKAIIAVDIAGYPADYDELHQMVSDNEIQSLYNPENAVQQKINRIAIVADAAHSIGGIYKGARTGNQADMSSFSFHAVKNLTTAEGGAVAFNLTEFSSQELQQKFKVSSLHGQNKDAFSKNQIGAWKYDVVEAGFKCNMTDLQAAIGLVELGRYQETLERRKKIFEKYQAAFCEKSWAKVPLFSSNNKTSSYHLYMLRIMDISEEQRDVIIAKISEKEVAVNVHYLPVPMLTFYKNKGYTINDYPQTFKNYKSEITLPVYYNLTDSQIETVINAVVESVEEVI